MPGIDLHTHSTASDGTVPPAGIVRLAAQEGLSAIALTDHDTVAGLPEFLAAGRELGITAVPGVELAVRGPSGTMDILGLWLPEHPAGLIEALTFLNARRAERNRDIAKRLASLGLDVTYEEIEAKAAGGTVGRPHIAQVLRDKGYVRSVQEAFETWIGDTGKAYLPKEVLKPETAVQLLKAEGATVLLAHPGHYRLTHKDLEKFLKSMAPHGMDGLEAYYPDHDARHTRLYMDMARRLDMLPSGGSDYHGRIKPDNRIGKPPIPDAVLEALLERRSRQGLPVPS